MSTPSNAAPEPALDAQAVATATLSPTQPLYWSVRRELWENRSIYIAPLAAAAVIFSGFFIGAIFTLARHIRPILALDPAKQSAALAIPYSMAATLIIFTGYIVGVFYCLDALYGERRDRSILFWKSLPVSDLTTVLSKAAVPLVVLPVVVFAIALATQLAMRLLSTVVLLASGIDAATLWARLPVFPMTLVLLYGLTVHVLWHAPLWAWLLLVSSWARRTPFLWAVLPPLALGLFERIAFQTTFFCALMKYRVIGAMAEAFVLKKEDKHLVLRLDQLDPVGFLGSPGLWIGLVAAAAFLAAAARLRRSREPI
jgi:ABC-2 type transport system permease protein